MSSRFDYIKFDELSKDTQLKCKSLMIEIERVLDDRVKNGRAKSVALTKLEEAYAWIGKAVRDAQIDRQATAEFQEGRSDV